MSMAKATGNNAAPIQKKIACSSAQKRMNAKIAPEPARPFPNVKKSAARKSRNMEK
jgi:hypothetical protein